MSPNLNFCLCTNICKGRETRFSYASPSIAQLVERRIEVDDFISLGSISSMESFTALTWSSPIKSSYGTTNLILSSLTSVKWSRIYVSLLGFPNVRKTREQEIVSQDLLVNYNNAQEFTKFPYILPLSTVSLSGIMISVWIRSLFWQSTSKIRWKHWQCHCLRISTALLNRPTQRVAPSWPNSSTGAALHRHRRGQASNPRLGMNLSGRSHCCLSIHSFVLVSSKRKPNTRMHHLR